MPLEIGQGRSLAQTLVQDPIYLSGANPFSPVMPVNSATLVSQLTGGKPAQKVGAVLRSCEIRALIELIKLQQANLDNLTIIGVDCLGTYEVEDYARLIGEMEGAAEEKGAQVVAEMRQQIEEGSTESSAVPLRTACQICLCQRAGCCGMEEMTRKPGVPAALSVGPRFFLYCLCRNSAQQW